MPLAARSLSVIAAIALALSSGGMPRAIADTIAPVLPYTAEECHFNGPVPFRKLPTETHLRFHSASGTQYWVSDYGVTPTDPEFYANHHPAQLGIGWTGFNIGDSRMGANFYASTRIITFAPYRSGEPIQLVMTTRAFRTKDDVGATADVLREAVAIRGIIAPDDNVPRWNDAQDDHTYFVYRDNGGPLDFGTFELP